MTRHTPHGSDRSDDTADLVRSVALSSARLWEEVLDRLERVEVSQRELAAQFAQFQSELPSGPRQPTLGAGTARALGAGASTPEGGGPAPGERRPVIESGPEVIPPVPSGVGARWRSPEPAGSFDALGDGGDDVIPPPAGGQQRWANDVAPGRDAAPAPAPPGPASALGDATPGALATGGEPAAGEGAREGAPVASALLGTHDAPDMSIEWHPGGFAAPPPPPEGFAVAGPGAGPLAPPPPPPPPPPGFSSSAPPPPASPVEFVAASPGGDVLPPPPPPEGFAVAGPATDLLAPPPPPPPPAGFGPPPPPPAPIESAATNPGGGVLPPPPPPGFAFGEPGPEAATAVTQPVPAEPALPHPPPLFFDEEVERSLIPPPPPPSPPARTEPGGEPGWDWPAPGGVPAATSIPPPPPPPSPHLAPPPPPVAPVEVGAQPTEESSGDVRAGGVYTPPPAPPGFSLDDLSGDTAIGAPSPPPPVAPVEVGAHPTEESWGDVRAGGVYTPPPAPPGFSLDDLSGDTAIGAPSPPPPPPPPPPPGFAVDPAAGEALAGPGSAPQVTGTPAPGAPVDSMLLDSTGPSLGITPTGGRAMAASTPPGFSVEDFSGAGAIGGTSVPSPGQEVDAGTSEAEPPTITPDFFARASRRRR
ncbi:MAG TPA: hypothetical protein VKV36_12865 [Acidimicrobiales bacterium]|nr:hypothetical protein [Acidimicrobiales bacterium]